MKFSTISDNNRIPNWWHLIVHVTQYIERERERCWINTCCRKFWTQKFPAIMYYCWNCEDIFWGLWKQPWTSLCRKLYICEIWLCLEDAKVGLLFSYELRLMSIHQHDPYQVEAIMSWHLCVSLHLQNPNPHLPNCDHHNSPGMTCKVCEPYLVTFLIRHLYLSGV